MKREEASRGESPVDLISREAGPQELPPGNHAMLAGSEMRDHPVGASSDGFTGHDPANPALIGLAPR